MRSSESESQLFVVVLDQLIASAVSCLSFVVVRLSRTQVRSARSGAKVVSL